MSTSPENSHRKPLDLRAIKDEAREQLRQLENPFVENVARSAEDPSCEKYDIAELFTQQRGEILKTIDQFRCRPARASEVFPILGDTGSGKTHLLAWLKRKLDLNRTEESSAYLNRVKKVFGSDGHLLVISEGFPNEQDIYGYLLRQIIDKLLSTQSHGPELLKAIGSRLAARMLADHIRKLDSAHQMALIAPTTVWDRIGRQFGSKATVESVQNDLDRMLAACEGDGLPNIPQICQAARADLNSILGAITAHIKEIHDGNSEGLVHRKILTALVRLAVIGDYNEVKQFLSSLIDPDADHLPGMVSPDKTTLKVILEILSVFKIPVIVAFDQLEDQLSASTSQERHELLVSFSHGIIKFLHSVPGICIFLFAEN